MTEQELDLLMRNVLLDAIALDEETNTETIPYTPSLHHQKQIKAMLKNPLRWARDRKQPVWKRALKRVAVILLVISLAFGSLMVVSPTARATFIRWVTEWYETHVTYRYAGDDMVGDIPEYTITELPEGYVENQEERIATQIQVSILYQSDTGYPITLHYIYIQQGAASQFVLDSTDEVVIDNINEYEAYIFVATDQENDSNAITWIDTQSNIQFTIQAQMSADDLVHMAESVSLCVSPKSK